MVSLDQRDTAISDLSKIAQVTTVAAADGTYDSDCSGLMAIQH